MGVVSGVHANNGRLALVEHRRFVYHQTMNVTRDADAAVARIAAAIGEPARARMLYCLMSGRARTATELALVAGISPATTSAHLNRLKAERLVRVVAQGKHRYFSVDNERVANLLESLSVVAGVSVDDFIPNTPAALRPSRTCYDHLAGTLGVALHDRLLALGWLTSEHAKDGEYTVTKKGVTALAALGIDVDAERRLRRRFAFACLDWSERRPHVGGAIGAALLRVAVTRRWLAPEPDSRAVRVTALGRRELQSRFGVRAE
jgi:DNA-binding transcriptional ArsR family regulator